MVLSKEVTGFYPNWLSSDLYLNLSYNSLSTIVWSFLGLNNDGSLIKTAYPPTNLISHAHSKGKKVVVSINPGWGSSVISTVLASSSVQNTLVNNLVYEVQTYGFDGVDIDFEGFPATNPISGQSNRILFTNFITTLSNALKAVNSNYRLTIDIPSTDWETVFDTGTLLPYVDYFMLMGYDYHWQTGPTAGAVAPLPSVINSINTYLQTIPSTKLILGVPYYGYEWLTQTQQPDSPTIGTGTSYTYNDILTRVGIYGRQWSNEWSCPYYLTGTGQGWYDDTESLSLKYDLVNQRNLAGIGIWALGFDIPRPELSNLITSKFGNGGFTGTCPNPNDVNVLGICADKTTLLIITGASAGLIALTLLS